VNTSTSGHSDILVVGGGVIGLAGAYFYATAGMAQFC
jgi:glycine/D-amino acid oxidase-like deaminating enzyme